jgi:hypothetical protein
LSRAKARKHTRAAPGNFSPGAVLRVSVRRPWGKMAVVTQRSVWIGAITIDCDDADVMRRFYAAALGGSTLPGFAQSVRVGGMTLIFRELEDWVRPIWPGGDMQMHFEILVNVGELEAQEARLISLGAEKSPHHAFPVGVPNGSSSADYPEQLSRMPDVE